MHKVPNIFIDGFLRLVHIDVQTESHGCTSVKQAEDENTEVYYGVLNARVTLKDLRIEVTMNPERGNWTDIHWARTKALSIVLEHSDQVLPKIMELSENIGFKKGITTARNQMKEALGLQGN